MRGEYGISVVISDICQGVEAWPENKRKRSELNAAKLLSLRERRKCQPRFKARLCAKF